jgi:hypothetical protein
MLSAVALWGLYLSFVQVGQLFYGYGWESQLLETGFPAVFPSGLRHFAPFGRRAAGRRAVALSLA